MFFRLILIVFAQYKALNESEIVRLLKDSHLIKAVVHSVSLYHLYCFCLCFLPSLPILDMRAHIMFELGINTVAGNRFVLFKCDPVYVLY